MKKVPKPKRNKIRKYAFLILLVIVIVTFFVSNYGYFQTFTEEDVIISILEYSDEFEEGQITDWESFCSSCGDDCKQRIDFQITFPRFEEWEKSPFDREYHCVKIVDGVNNFDEEGIYYGVARSSFDSLISLDPRESHEFTICCGVETYDMAQKLAEFAGVFNEENFFYHRCVTEIITKKC